MHTMRASVAAVAAPGGSENRPPNVRVDGAGGARSLTACSSPAPAAKSVAPDASLTLQPSKAARSAAAASLTRPATPRHPVSHVGNGDGSGSGSALASSPAGSAASSQRDDPTWQQLEHKLNDLDSKYLMHRQRVIGVAFSQWQSQFEERSQQERGTHAAAEQAWALKLQQEVSRGDALQTQLEQCRAQLQATTAELEKQRARFKDLHNRWKDLKAMLLEKQRKQAARSPSATSARMSPVPPAAGDVADSVPAAPIPADSTAMVAAPPALLPVPSPDAAASKTAATSLNDADAAAVAPAHPSLSVVFSAPLDDELKIEEELFPRVDVAPVAASSRPPSSSVTSFTAPPTSSGSAAAAQPPAVRPSTLAFSDSVSAVLLRTPSQTHASAHPPPSIQGAPALSPVVEESDDDVVVMSQPPAPAQSAALSRATPAPAMDEDVIPESRADRTASPIPVAPTAPRAWKPSPVRRPVDILSVDESAAAYQQRQKKRRREAAAEQQCDSGVQPAAPSASPTKRVLPAMFSTDYQSAPRKRARPSATSPIRQSRSPSPIPAAATASTSHSIDAPNHGSTVLAPTVVTSSTAPALPTASAVKPLVSLSALLASGQPLSDVVKAMAAAASTHSPHSAAASVDATGASRSAAPAHAADLPPPKRAARESPQPAPHRSSHEAMSTNGPAVSAGTARMAASAPAPYISSVRQRDAREALPGYACKQCEDFYKSVGFQSTDQGARSCSHASRHRYEFAPPLTPEAYWNICSPAPPLTYESPARPSAHSVDAAQHDQQQQQQQQQQHEPAAANGINLEHALNQAHGQDEAAVARAPTVLDAPMSAEPPARDAI